MTISGVNCLITGANGFVGASLARRLSQGGGNVFLLVRPGSDPWRLKGLEERILPCDLLDKESLKTVLAQSRPDRVYHLAAHGGYPFQKDPARILETNLMGTLNLLQACAQSPCRLFVQAGSSSEYGFKKEPMRETDLLEPNSYYAVGKAAATHLCSFFGATAPFAAVTLRLFSVYGPFEEPTRFIPTLLRRALRHEPIELAARDTARDFIYVEDVVEAFLRTDALKALGTGVLNIGSGVQSTLGDAVRIAMELTGSKSELRWGAMEPRAWDAACWVASIEKSRVALDWRPLYGLSQGLEKTLRWMGEAL